MDSSRTPDRYATRLSQAAASEGSDVMKETTSPEERPAVRIWPSPVHATRVTVAPSMTIASAGSSTSPLLMSSTLMVSPPHTAAFCMPVQYARSATPSRISFSLCRSLPMSSSAAETTSTWPCEKPSSTNDPSPTQQWRTSVPYESRNASSTGGSPTVGVASEARTR